MPIRTSLYRMNVLPASMPSASLNTMVIVGPSLLTRWMAMPMATSAASSGMIQMIEIRRRFFRVTTACGQAVEIRLVSHGRPAAVRRRPR